jgi:hypothetical protein
LHCSEAVIIGSAEGILSPTHDQHFPVAGTHPRYRNFLNYLVKKGGNYDFRLRWGKGKFSNKGLREGDRPYWIPGDYWCN